MTCQHGDHQTNTNTPWTHLLYELLDTLYNMFVELDGLQGGLCDNCHLCPRHRWLRLIQRRQLQTQQIICHDRLEQAKELSQCPLASLTETDMDNSSIVIMAFCL